MLQGERKKNKRGYAIIMRKNGKPQKNKKKTWKWMEEQKRVLRIKVKVWVSMKEKNMQFCRTNGKRKHKRSIEKEE